MFLVFHIMFGCRTLLSRYLKNLHLVRDLFPSILTSSFSFNFQPYFLSVAQAHHISSI